MHFANNLTATTLILGFVDIAQAFRQRSLPPFQALYAGEDIVSVRFIYADQHSFHLIPFLHGEQAETRSPFFYRMTTT